ncbi:MAG TPA: 16S rRNA (guanine(527)-N(7))-methyltransferase RsmG [Candidatus Angelobacter sp.]|nr:16S rRNA (guanine(527)-N(7))-methyltransferase RsmG [Candidatus Angelobacter sp.]
MDTSAIAQLLEPYIQLDESRLAAISKYIDLLLKWNARMNLTAIRGPQEMVQRHFGESFFAANHVLSHYSQRPMRKIIDLGSGAGFPGVPFAMMAPAAEVTLIESNQKKATFLRELIFLLGLKNTKVFDGRGESYTRTADVVTMRAVESFTKALPLAIQLAEPEGKIMLMIGSAQVVDTASFGDKVEWSLPILVPGGHSRALLVGKNRP